MLELNFMSDDNALESLLEFYKYNVEVICDSRNIDNEKFDKLYNSFYVYSGSDRDFILLVLEKMIDDCVAIENYEYAEFLKEIHGLNGEMIRYDKNKNE